MNKRIKQLAEQASHQSPDGYPVTIPYSKDFAKKFAELIVRECVAICQDVDGEDSIEAKSGRQDCAVEIREHFGVEE